MDGPFVLLYGNTCMCSPFTFTSLQHVSSSSPVALNLALQVFGIVTVPLTTVGVLMLRPRNAVYLSPPLNTKHISVLNNVGINLLIRSFVGGRTLLAL